MSTADPQRALVYEAEQTLATMIDRRLDFPVVSAFGSRVTLPDDRKFGDLDSVQRYLDAVLALDWVASPRPVRVRARAGATKAEYEFATSMIAVPPHRVGGRWAMRELVILHELAHHLSQAADHGPAFTTSFLELVTELVGAEAGFLLRSGWLAAGVAVG